MCLLAIVFSGYTAFHKHCLCIRHEKLCHTPSLYVYTHACSCMCVCVCVFRRGQQWKSLAWQTAVLFLGGLPFPSGGPHWRALALSVSPLRLRESGQAQTSRLAGCCSSTQPAGAVACTQPSNHSTTLHTDGWTAYWQTSVTFSLVLGKWMRGIPPPSLWKQTLRFSPAVLYPCV